MFQERPRTPTTPEFNSRLVMNRGVNNKQEVNLKVEIRDKT